MKTEDWTSINCNSDYSLFEKLHGACYYYVAGPASAEGFGEAASVHLEEFPSVPADWLNEALAQRWSAIRDTSAIIVSVAAAPRWLRSAIASGAPFAAIT